MSNVRTWTKQNLKHISHFYFTLAVCLLTISACSFGSTPPKDAVPDSAAPVTVSPGSSLVPSASGSIVQSQTSESSSGSQTSKSSSESQTSATNSTSTPSSSQSINPSPSPSTPSRTVDLTKLPIGDGKVTTTVPKRGYIYMTNTNMVGGGAFRAGEWIKADGTYDITQKVTVDGQVTWPHKYSIQLQGTQRVFQSNEYPNHPTGIYPVRSQDDAYQYDRNPNSIKEQNFSLTLPAVPQVASNPSPLTMGAIGIMVTGSVIYNGLDAQGKDAVANEIQDTCSGHPERSGEYHYHNLSSCIDDPQTGKHSILVGYAFDGFGIYGKYGEDGALLTNADLDECHGHTHEMTWDGKKTVMYHYHTTYEYPYTLGCYRGSPVKSAKSMTPPAGGSSNNSGNAGSSDGMKPPPRPPQPK